MIHFRITLESIVRVVNKGSPRWPI